MAKFPPIDLTEFVKLLKSEGKTELCTACLGKGNATFKLLNEWDNILSVLEMEIVPALAKGGDIKTLIRPAQSLARSAGVLASMASQVLSFVPGPIGIVCSAINAIVCFCTLPVPVNIGNGMLELLGCIPGGKVVGKLAPKIEKILLKVIVNSPELSKAIKDGEKIANLVKNFAEKASKNISKTPTKPVVKPKTSNVGYYNNMQQGHFPPLEETLKMNSKQTGSIKTGRPRILNPSTNYQQYILSTKTGKYDPYSHLFPY